jgi:hypothetical protein
LHLDISSYISTSAATGSSKMDMDEEPFPQQLDAFPQQMSDAAKVFPNFSAAYAQLRSGGDYINLHLQAPEIMMRFAGRVQFGMGSPRNSF